MLKAGNTKGSPQLNSFGPNMLLAKELLEIGEMEIVIAYMELCKQFWHSTMRLVAGRPLKKWKQSIENGEIPDFGANLNYQM